MHKPTSYPDDLLDAIKRNVNAALLEDLGDGKLDSDLTLALVSKGEASQAQLISRDHAILCGQPWFDACILALDPTASITWNFPEGHAIAPNDVVCHIRGEKRGLLAGERSAMNFLQLLSACATVTRHYVDAVANLPVHIVDTRKTIPGLRRAQKYAVTIGGGVNHRMGLYDGVLIKENHIVAAGGLKKILSDLRAHNKAAFVEVEVETLDQLKAALDAEVPFILLDNMDLAIMRKAVELRGILPCKLEASGGVNLHRVREIAQTGVDRISIGALTKDVVAIDFSLRHTA